METKRARGRNFSECEKQIALYVIEKFRHIVECKETDGMSIKKKNSAWEQIAEEFNTLSTASPRDPRQLKVYWWNLKRTAKKTVAARTKKNYVDLSSDDVETVMAMLKKKQAEDQNRIVGTFTAGYRPEMEAGVLTTVKEEVYDDVTTVKEEICDEDINNPQPELAEETPVSFSDCPQEDPAPVGGNKSGPSKSKGKVPRLSTLQLKRVFYLKKIKLVNMEINYKRKLYELELRLKEKELNK